MITPDQLHTLTATLPMKQIDIDGQPYLRRYHAARLGDGSDVWLHHFLSSDGDRHLHNHPWEALAIVLHGGYTEIARRDGEPQVVRSHVAVVEDGPSLRQLARWTRAHPAEPAPGPFGPEHLRMLQRFPGTFELEHFRHYGRMIAPFDWHRIAEVQPDTWTCLIVRPHRLPYWYFRVGPTDLAIPMESSPADWFEAYGPREETADE